MSSYARKEAQSSEEIKVLDSILKEWRTRLGRDWFAYRNHCIRVILFYQALQSSSPGDTEPAVGKLAIATAYHDLGIWTHRTFDYLQPSVDLAMEHLTRNGLPAWREEIKEAIEMHHKVTSVRRSGDESGSRRQDKDGRKKEGRIPESRLPGFAETFRRADWIDVSLGILRFGVPPAFIREVKIAYPDRGFHRRLVELTLQRIREKPWSPLPMLRL